MSNNLIKFPKDSFPLFPSTEQESLDHLNMVRQEYCDEVTSDVTEAIFSVLHSYGFILKSDNDHIKDVVFLEEAVKAMIYRYKKLGHPLHEIINNTVNLPDEADDEIVKEKQLNN